MPYLRQLRIVLIKRLPPLRYLTSTRWNEWITLPIKIRDLPQSAQLVFTLWDLYSPRRYTPVGGTTFRLFTQAKCVRRCRRGCNVLYVILTVLVNHICMLNLLGRIGRAG